MITKKYFCKISKVDRSVFEPEGSRRLRQSENCGPLVSRQRILTTLECLKVVIYMTRVSWKVKELLLLSPCFDDIF